MRNRLLFLILLAACVGGCTMAPKYRQPDAPVAAHWPGTATNAAATGPSEDIAWPDFVGDARLRRIVELALTNNRDLRIAALRVEQARARHHIERSRLFPEIDAEAGANRERVSADFSPTGTARTSSQYRASAGLAAYEVDFFGRVRSLRDQALEIYLATEEARKSARISLVSEVARQYLALQLLEEQRALSRQTLEASGHRLDLTTRRHELGDASALEVEAVKTQVESARADIAALGREIELSGNALTRLVGTPLPRDLAPAGGLDDDAFLADLQPGLPADLLQRRPDIQEAEHLLRAANANIGAARAAFFPRVLLTAYAGSASLEVADLFTGPTKTWSYGPRITVPIFDGGYNRANLEVAKIEKRIEIARYEKAIQSAFQEVADALATRRWIGDEIAARRNLEAAQSQRHQLAQARHDGGVDSYLSVLTAMEDLYAARQRVIATRFLQLANRIELYRALGGGWQEP